jgi:hypothetical protein
MILVAGTDYQRPHESIPVRHRMIPGITSVTTPGSRRMARRCFHANIGTPSAGLLVSPSPMVWSQPEADQSELLE